MIVFMIDQVHRFGQWAGRGGELCHDTLAHLTILITEK